MMMLFTYTAEHSIKNITCSDFFKRLPEVISEYSDFDYSYQNRDTRCFLKPTFKNMTYKNSFVPEIEIVASCNGAHTVLHMRGRPVKAVRIFMAVWFSLLLMMEAVILFFTIVSRLDNLIPIFLPIVMVVYGYLLCKIGTKVSFNSIVKVIKREFS